MALYRGINTDAYSVIAGWEVSNDNGLTWAAATQLPTVADSVYANGFIKDVDIDAFAFFYSNRPSTNVNLGGRFNIGTGVTMLGDVRHRHATNILACVYKNSAGDSWIVGDVYGHDQAGTQGNPGIVVSAISDGARVDVGTLRIVGSAYSGLLRGGTNSFRAGCVGARSSGNGMLLVSGDAIGDTTFTFGVSTAAPNGIVFDSSKCVVDGRGYNWGAGGCVITEIQESNDSCIVTSKFIMPTTNQPTWVNCKAKTGANVQIEIYDELNQPILCNPLFAQDQASPDDVRLGTTYANGALTGTLPPATTLETVLAAIASIKPVP